MSAGRRFDGGAWLVLGIAAAWCLLTAFVSAVGLKYPSDGFTFTRNSPDGPITLNIRFHALPTPLRTGDIVLAINGQPMSSTVTAPVGKGTRAGEVLVYTLERDGQVVDIPVTLAAPGPAGLWTGLLLRLAQPRGFIVASLTFAIGLWTFLARPNNLGGRYLLLTFSYYFAVQWFGFFISDLYIPLMPAWLVILAGLEGSGWFWFFFPSMTLVALSFPVVKRPLRRFPRLLPACLYGLPLAFGLLIGANAAGLTNTAAAGVAAEPIFIGVLLVTIVALAGSILHNWFTLREPVTWAQLQWVTLGLTLGLLVPFAWLLISVALNGGFPSSDLLLWLPLAIPITLAIAITRYRLFDIDVIIRRTLIYSVLTAILALAYFGSILVLEGVVRGLTGGDSPLVIVLSTLFIAALFVPVRKQVQRMIDRRFYRRKYDAARTLASFGTQARDVVELEQLEGRLVAVVKETMQPAHLGLWVRPAQTEPPRL
jgi:hypothetical protein